MKSEGKRPVKRPARAAAEPEPRPVKIKIGKFEFATPGGRTRVYPADSIVEKAIRLANEKWGGSPPDNPAELRQRLIEAGRRHISSQMMYEWRRRSNFPRDWVPFVMLVTGIPLEELIQYRPGK